MKRLGTPLVVQWPRLHAPNAGGLGLIPGQGTRAHMPELNSNAATGRSFKLQLRPCAFSQMGKNNHLIVTLRKLKWFCLLYVYLRFTCLDIHNKKPISGNRFSSVNSSTQDKRLYSIINISLRWLCRNIVHFLSVSLTTDMS